MSIELKAHQQEAYDGITEEFKNGNRAAVVHPTGTGKSYIALKLIEDNQEKQVLYLAPSISILHQIKENSIKHNGQMFSGLERMTYRKLSRLSSEQMREINPDIIVLDEFHHCGAPVWGASVDKLCDMFPNAKVLGLSATPIRYFDGNIDMAEEMFGEHVVSEISFIEALERDILPGFDYVSAMYGYEDKLLQLKERIENSSAIQTKKDEARKLFQELSKQLSKDTEDLPEVLEKHMANKNGKYMVFCSNIEEMQKKIQEAQELFSKINPNIKIYSVSSSEDLKNNQKVLKQFEKDNDENTLKLMFSVNMLNEGYHLPDIDGVIMMRPTKSPTIYMQQMGRALTVGNSSKKPIIIDLVDNFDSIRVIEEVTGALSGRNIDGIDKEKKNKVIENEKFKIIDYTKNIGEISRKIEKLSRLRSLSMSEKIDLFEKFMNENPDETIHYDTVFEGFPIGSYLIQIRQSMIYGKGKLEYSQKDKERLEKLGLLYEGLDTIETRIERLKAYCKEHPYVFSNVADLKKKLEKEGNRDEIEYIEKLYESDYKYILQRISNGKLPKDIEQDLKNAKIGGVFGFTKEDEELIKKYGISKKMIIQLNTDFGSIDNFRKAYIQYKIDLANAKTYEEKEKVAIKNENIVNCRRHLPLVGDFYLCKKKSYIALANSILNNNFYIANNVFGNELDVMLNNFLEASLREVQKNVITLRFGLEDEQPKSLEETGVRINKSGARARQIETIALRELRRKGELLQKQIFEPTEEFIKVYFEIHDVFYSEDEPQMNREDIEKLMDICREKQTKVEENKEKDSPPIVALDLSTKTYNCLKKHYGKIEPMTIADLLEEIEEPKDLLKISYMGKKSAEEVIEKVHQLGFKFKYEEEKNDIEQKRKQVLPSASIDVLRLSARLYNCLKKHYGKIETMTIADLLEEIEEPEDLLKIRNMGKKSAEEVIEKVHKLGFRFKYEEEQDNKELNLEQVVQEEPLREETEYSSSTEENSENSTDSFSELVQAIESADSKYAEISKIVEELNAQKENILQKINQLLQQLNEMSNGNITQEIATTMPQVYQLLQEQRKKLQYLDRAIAEAQKLEETNREERVKLTEKYDGMIQGGN